MLRRSFAGKLSRDEATHCAPEISLTRTATCDDRIPAGRPMTRTTRGAVLITVTILLVITSVRLMAYSVRPGWDTAVSRQERVFENGRRVMTFDQEQTTHIFTESADGGTQRVLALDSNDTTNIRLIREHLQQEAQRFQTGDLSDPAAIHGQEMPGLAELSQAAKDKTLLIAYQELPSGGLLTYLTKRAAVRVALYAWFDAQRNDHGVHAR